MAQPSRREANRTDQSEDSAFSVSLQEAGIRSLHLEEALSARVSGDRTGDEQLARMLSCRSVNSTTSSTAERNNTADPETHTFRSIGTGSVGMLFEHPGTNKCYKLPIRDLPESKNKIWDNYKCQLQVQSAFGRAIARNPGAVVQVQIPQAFWYANQDTADFWTPNIDRFEWSEGFKKRTCPVLCMERIFPVTKPVRDLLITAFIKPAQQAAAHASPSNKDCLIRPFLGREQRGSGNLTRSLRNFILHVNDFEKHGFPAKEYAIAMAQALAILHWEAHLDGYDIEFLVGTSPNFKEEQAIRRPLAARDVEELKPDTSTFERVANSKGDFKSRLTDLYMLDFDAMKPITADSNGVDRAVKAFVETAPYFPRPHSGNAYQENLWDQFVFTYLLVSNVLITRPENKRLPQDFVDRVSAKIEVQRKGKENAPSTPSHGRGGSVGNVPLSPSTRIWNGGAASPSPVRRRPSRSVLASPQSLPNLYSTATGRPSIDLPYLGRPSNDTSSGRPSYESSSGRRADRGSDDVFGGGALQSRQNISNTTRTTGGEHRRDGRGGGGGGGRGDGGRGARRGDGGGGGARSGGTGGRSGVPPGDWRRGGNKG